MTSIAKQVSDPVTPSRAPPVYVFPTNALPDSRLPRGRRWVQVLAHEPVEVFSVLCLSVKHRVVGYAPVSRGTLDSTIVHPREVFRAALMASAASICLVHNHPSGDPRPSPDDDLLTVRLVACGDLMGIEVVDHVIVAEHGYFSYREAGRLRVPGTSVTFRMCGLPRCTCNPRRRTVIGLEDDAADASDSLHETTEVG